MTQSKGFSVTIEVIFDDQGSTMRLTAQNQISLEVNGKYLKKEQLEELRGKQKDDLNKFQTLIGDSLDSRGIDTDVLTEGRRKEKTKQMMRIKMMNQK